MATDMQKLIGTSEEDDEEGMEMDVKEEDDDDESGEKLSHVAATPIMVRIDGVMPASSSNNNHRFQQHQQIQEVGTPGGGGARRCRPLEEKERTKLRERHRRAITARILAGLRRHGNYNLRVRADINDVIAALAREAGWVVLPDGTTFPSRSQPQVLISQRRSFVSLINILFVHVLCHIARCVCVGTGWVGGEREREESKKL